MIRCNDVYTPVLIFITVPENLVVGYVEHFHVVHTTVSATNSSYPWMPLPTAGYIYCISEHIAIYMFLNVTDLEPKHNTTPFALMMTILIFYWFFEVKEFFFEGWMTFGQSICFKKTPIYVHIYYEYEATFWNFSYTLLYKQRLCMPP